MNIINRILGKEEISSSKVVTVHTVKMKNKSMKKKLQNHFSGSLKCYCFTIRTNQGQRIGGFADASGKNIIWVNRPKLRRWQSMEDYREMVKKEVSSYTSERFQQRYGYDKYMKEVSEYYKHFMEEGK